MKAGFYEFEFTVAFIHDYLKRHEDQCRRAVVGMPTPMEESKVGYDATIAANGHSRFFQFKRPDYLPARTGKQRLHYPSQPYYRINITPHEKSKQHNLLVQLARKGHEVYYVAPIFYDVREMDTHRDAQQILENSIWVPTRGMHLQTERVKSCITYLPNHHYMVHPEPTRTFRSQPEYGFPAGTPATRPLDHNYYARLLRDLNEVVDQVIGREPERQEPERELRPAHVLDFNRGVPRARMVEGPDTDEATRDVRMVRDLLHSRFQLRMITVSEVPADVASQTDQP